MTNELNSLRLDIDDVVHELGLGFRAGMIRWMVGRLMELELWHFFLGQITKDPNYAHSRLGCRVAWSRALSLYLQECSTTQIAQALGVSRSTAARWVNRAAWYIVNPCGGLPELRRHYSGKL